MSEPVAYLHLKPGSDLPERSGFEPVRMLVVVEAQVSPEWQTALSNWIVKSGCLYMMAWGVECGSWDDSVDMANLEEFEFGDIPEDRFVMTTWHADEPLAEVFWFSKNCAFHPTVEVRHTVLLHIAAESKEHELLAAYAEA